MPRFGVRQKRNKRTKRVHNILFSFSHFFSGIMIRYIWIFVRALPSYPFRQVNEVSNRYIKAPSCKMSIWFVFFFHFFVVVEKYHLQLSNSFIHSLIYNRVSLFLVSILWVCVFFPSILPSIDGMRSGSGGVGSITKHTVPMDTCII